MADHTSQLEVDDEMHRHIGAIVQVGAEMEHIAAYILVMLANPDDPMRMKSLFVGRRMSEAIDNLTTFLPDFTDRDDFIRALRSANAYRDRLAHSTRDFNPDDIGNLTMRTLARHQRRTSSTHRMDMTTARDVERLHILLLATLEVLYFSFVRWPADKVHPAPSIREELERSDPALAARYDDVMSLGRP